MKKTVIYPGTFDPITFGHLDVIQRASELFDTVIVAVLENAAKRPLFTKEERVEMIKVAVKSIPNVEVDVFDGLLVEYAKRKGAIAIIRGLRAVSDFEYEFQMALMNRKISSGITTVFLMPHEKYTYLNSSIVRELARLNANVSDFVPQFVAEKLKEKFSKK
ncbi:MAG: pantetheine-phosphate adenylyltransferase [Ignavibacteria bacterium]|jgi:pantetheine-phosphate adenylyltransferase|nr:pantetheine-phosphate adenylyltransferase [Ignavibacteria bacterium]MDH7528344.1 pantetheine-phosphate adenylyltransferase [Ignavibacteria bacterium]